jgi:hypothetical protein
MHRMIAWTMTTWRRSHDAYLLVCISYYGSNLYRHHASALKFRVFLLSVITCVTSALIQCMEVPMYIIWKYYYNQVYSTEILFFWPEASGNGETPMEGTLRHQRLCLGTVGASGASYILQDAQCHLLWPGHWPDFINIIVRAVGTAPQSAARSARWVYHGLPSKRAVRAAKIKLIITSRDARARAANEHNS